jgi:hypothetical protein
MELGSLSNNRELVTCFSGLGCRWMMASEPIGSYEFEFILWCAEHDYQLDANAILMNLSERSCEQTYDYLEKRHDLSEFRRKPKFLQYAENKPAVFKLLVKKGFAVIQADGFSNLRSIKIALKKNLFSWYKYYAKIAQKKGDLDFLRWAHRRGFPMQVCETHDVPLYVQKWMKVLTGAATGPAN